MKSPSCTVYVGLAQARPNYIQQLSVMSEQQPIIITDGNDNELIAELSTELNSDDLRRLAGEEWLNDKVNQFQC